MSIFATPTLSPLFESDDLEMKYDSVPSTENFVMTNHDLLLLSCTLYRLIKQDRDKYSCFSLISDATAIESEVLSADRIFADNIRQYFANMLVLFVMKVGTLSKFKHDLNKYLTTDFRDSSLKYMTPEKYVGMCYKLPYFYEYNQNQLALFQNHSMQVVGLDRYHDTKKVRFLTKLDPRRRKSSNMIEYWFEDELKNRITVDIDKNNPLLTFLENVLDKPLTLEAKFNKRNNYNVEYYVTSTGWKLSL